MEGQTKPFLNEKLPLQQLQALDSLIEVLIKPERFARDLFFALLLILMRENDFLQIKAPNEPPIDISNYILSTRKKNTDIYDATLVLNGFQDIPIKILAMPLDNVMVVNAVILNTNQTYAVCLEVTKFIAISDLKVPFSINNYTDLQTMMKEITEPVKSCIFNQRNAKRGTLLSLPESVLLKILLNLRTKDVLNLSESCKIMNCIVKEDRVWHRLYNRDFCGAYKCGEGGWFELYRQMYVSRRLMDDVQIRHWDITDYVTCTNNKFEIIL